MTLTAIDVDCPECGVDVGKPCRIGDVIQGYKDVAYFHDRRHESAEFSNRVTDNMAHPQAETDDDQPSEQEFTDAINMTGLV